MVRTIHARILSTVAFGIFSLLVSVPKAHADSFTISPPKFEVFGNPGDTISDKIKIDNDNATDVLLQANANDFVAQGDTGAINLVEDPNAPTTNFSLARWMTISPSKFTVPAHGEKVISFTIKLPKGAEPGGKYASVLITRAGERVDGGASVNSAIGSLILLRVSGAITENLSVDTFKTDDTYYQHGPVTFELRTKNSGNVHVAPAGTIVITNMFGKKTAELPLTDANVLPGAFRAIRTTFADVPIGRYTATVVANYGQSNQKIAASTSFTLIPVWLIAAAIGAVILLFLMLSGRKKFKRLINRLTSD